ncbi:LOW QUALITY PROTEIN: adhesion G protein-coupled receptor A3 [Atheta coriaria]|uniref:LOW QUALITY PROTEIN: adhesion G protein-coupled receptor A3 n=1 Tax=Dalotia coriaria TaxID=877792 RepID=UPI0031F3B023
MWRFLCALLVSLHFAAIISDQCPSKCVCKRSTAQRDGGDWVKVRCGDVDKLTVIDDNEFLNIANEIVQLNLSNNSLTIFAPKVQFVALQKLDLSKNQLVQLTNNQFSELPNLRRLDLSGNSIKIIDQLSFNNLQVLESLKLSQNQIVTIEKGTFTQFQNLKDLDISGNPLKCDCSLLWLLDWTKKMTVKLKSNPKCATPPAYFGRALRKIKVGEDIHCKSPAKNRDIPIVDLTPDHSQVVFEGDSLRLNCRAPSMPEEYYKNEENEESHDRVEWLWLEKNARHYFNDVTIDNRFLADDGLIDSLLTIRRLNRNHSGVWNCHLITRNGNYTKGITVMVISDETVYCPIILTSNNKGTYTWPRTVVNHTVTLNCESLQQTSDVYEQKASYSCSPTGWVNLNTSKCPYTSETTKILEQFAKVNLTLAKGSILESAKHLRNTSDIKLMRDVMDLVFATRTIYNYLDHLQVDGELGPLLLDIINGFMELDESFIREAQREDNSCGKLIRAVEKITNYTLPQQLQKSHIILGQFPVRRETFTGLTCTWYLNGVGGRSDKIFHCVTQTHNKSNAMIAQNKVIEASIEVPSNIFYQLQEVDIMLSAGNVRVGMYDDARFFPLAGGDRERIISAVVGVKLDNLLVNLTHPIYIMLKPLESYSYDLTPPTPVWWNPSLNLGRGAWTSQGCQIRHELEDNLVFTCDHLGYYALLQDTSHVHIVPPGAKFRFSHPAIYVGSLVLFICLFLCIVSYAFSYSAIQMPKKAKHSVINLWLSITLLCFIYVFGIYQTEDVRLCQIIGLILHYLSLSSLLWMCVAVNSMYKRLKRSDDVIELQDDELPSDEPVQKPILGLYLVGWGIALIVCGISGAVNMKEYSARTHCFLSTGPALSALYAPFALLLMLLFVYFLLIRCAIYGTDANGHLSEGTQATENVDLDLLEPNFPDCRSMRSVSTKTASSEVEDSEHAPMAQLKAHVIFLILYVMAWCACALATMNTFKMIPYEEDVFSIVYAILASLLGLFAFFFYCVARNDVRNEWILTSRLMRGRKCFRTRNISDLPQIQIQPLPPIPEVAIQHGGLQSIHPIHGIHSRSSSRSSHTKSGGSNALKMAAAVDLNASAMTDHSATKINNVNLVVLHRQQYRNNGALIPNLIENPTHSAEMFYNPHQSTVARKFFKKQKRHMMKRNNLTQRRPPLGLHSDASVISTYTKNPECNMDVAMFANNSKVNNTNIHVEHVPKRHHNLNILSDSCEDLNSVEIPVEKLLEQRRNKGKRVKKKQNAAAAITNLSNNKQKQVSLVSKPKDVSESRAHDNMRSVSQQCTLEYSSEAISDSILDQKSPERPSFTTETTTSISFCTKENSPNMSTLTEELPPQMQLGFYSIPKDDFSSSARIYVNPTFARAQSSASRASSVSATEIEELYQQIKRGPAPKSGGSRNYRKGGIVHACLIQRLGHTVKVKKMRRLYRI